MNSSSAFAPNDASARVAYIVLSHRDPAQVARLTDRLVRSDPNGQVVIAHDPAAGLLPLDGLASGGRVHVRLSSAVRRWGGFGLVSDLLESIEWTLEHLDVGWVAILSGQDYPLRPLAGYGEELAASGFDAFVTARRVPFARPPADDSPGLYLDARFYYRWWRLPRWLLGWTHGRRVDVRVSGLLRQFSARQRWVFVWRLPRGAGDMIGVRRRRLPFDEDWPCWVGSQWLTLSRRAAEEIRTVLAARPDLVSLYRRSIIADESLPVTILCNAPSLRVCRTNHHWIRMTGPGLSHASVLTTEDLPTLRASGKWFARKFDPAVDATVLDRLDDQILVAAS